MTSSFSLVRVFRPEDIPPPDETVVDVAILDMNHNWPNLGHDLERVPPRERSNWCLQEKLTYAPVLEAKDGGRVKVEIRMMVFKPEGRPPIIAQNLCRLSRGKMMGVDFNKNFTWVGSSLALWPT